MIAADASTWIAYLRSDTGPDTDRLDRGLADRAVVMLPAVLAEIFSAPLLTPDHIERCSEVLLCSPATATSAPSPWPAA